MAVAVAVVLGVRNTRKENEFNRVVVDVVVVVARFVVVVAGFGLRVLHNRDQPTARMHRLLPVSHGWTSGRANGLRAAADGGERRRDTGRENDRPARNLNLSGSDRTAAGKT